MTVIDPKILDNLANRLAAARGATHFVTGRYEGQVWQWTFTVDVYAVAPSGPTVMPAWLPTSLTLAPLMQTLARTCSQERPGEKTA